MSVPLEVRRTIWVETMRFWYVLLSHDGDPYAIEEYGVLPGGRLPNGWQMPDGPEGILPEGLAPVEVIPHLPAYEDALRSVHILPTGNFEAIGSQALGLIWRGAAKLGINLDRTLPPAPFNRTRYSRNDPKDRWRRHPG